jgi:DNA invertase Pin-like site-specific DNA recombinase
MRAMGLLLGYVRVSTTDQGGQAQFDALREAGVPEEHIYFDQLSGAKAAKDRPGLTALLAYARRDDTVLVYRIDRLGRSLIDILNTVADMQKRGIGLRSLVDGIDPSTPTGRLQLGLFATLAEYERELINERVRAGMLAAKERGAVFGQKPVDQETVEAKLEIARRLLAEGKTATKAAELVGWSRPTLYRYLKQRGAEQPPAPEKPVARGRARSQYAKVKPLPERS